VLADLVMAWFLVIHTLSSAPQPSPSRKSYTRVRTHIGMILLAIDLRIATVVGTKGAYRPGSMLETA
jgi:hypothetical protein